MNKYLRRFGGNCRVKIMGRRHLRCSDINLPRDALSVLHIYLGEFIALRPDVTKTFRASLDMGSNTWT